MKKNRSLMLVATASVLSMLLSACGVLPFGDTTPTQDVNAVMTSAAATAFIQLTDIANSAAATDAAKPTATLQATETTVSQPTALEQITQTPESSLPTTATATTGLPVAATAPGLPTATTSAMNAIAATATTGTTIVIPSNATAAKACYSSLFISDVTIPDNTAVKKLEKFTKIWKIQNNGTCDWSAGFGLVYFNGEKMNALPSYFSKNDAVIKPGGQVDIAIHMQAPDKKGQAYSEWIMVDATGKSFGYPFYVMVDVK